MKKRMSPKLRFAALLPTLMPVLLPMLLAACDHVQKPMPDPECRQAAYDDEKVKEKRYKNAGIAAFGLSQNDRDDLAYLQNDAYNACMRRRGLAPPGGVEQVRPQR